MATLVTTAEVLLMPNGANGSSRELILQSFAKAGPWALLSMLLIGGIGYMLHEFTSTAGPAVAQYVTASRKIDEKNAENVSLLTIAQQRTSEEHKSMLEGLTTLQSAIQLRQQEHTDQSSRIDEMLKIMSDASKLMEPLPGQRNQMLTLLQEMQANGNEQSRLLEQLISGIAELRRAIEVETADAPPDGT